MASKMHKLLSEEVRLLYRKLPEWPCTILQVPESDPDDYDPRDEDSEQSERERAGNETKEAR